MSSKVRSVEQNLTIQIYYSCKYSFVRVYVCLQIGICASLLLINIILVQHDIIVIYCDQSDAFLVMGSTLRWQRAYRVRVTGRVVDHATTPHF